MPTFPDPTGKPERHAEQAQPLQLWVKPQPHGAHAILLLNMLHNETVDILVDFAALGFGTAGPGTSGNAGTRTRTRTGGTGTGGTGRGSAAFAVRDVWRHEDMGVSSSLTVSVPGYDSRMYLLTAV